MKKNGNSHGKTKACEGMEHARIVRHKIKRRDVKRGLTFALADARSIREARGVQRSENSRIYSIIDPNPRRLDMELARTSNPQRPNRRNNDAASPNLMESACKCMHSRPRLFVTQTQLLLRAYHHYLVYRKVETKVKTCSKSNFTDFCSRASGNTDAKTECYQLR